MSCHPSEPSAVRSFVSSAGATRAASVWPPRNPMLIRWGRSLPAISLAPPGRRTALPLLLSRRLHKLRKHSARRGGVKECDPGPADPVARTLVDQSHPSPGQLLERTLHILDSV